MHLIRRIALRGLQKQSLTTSTRSFTSRRGQSVAPPSRTQTSVAWVARRFYSEDKNNVSSAEGQDGEPVKTEPSIEEQRAEVIEESIATPEVADAATEGRSAAATVSDAAGAAVGAASDAMRSVAEATGFGRSGRNREEEPKPSRILYIGNLFFDLSPQKLRETFEEIGKVVNCRIITDNSGMSKGFGYIEFEHLEDATNAVAALDQVILEGRRMAVQYHVPKNKTIAKHTQRNPPSRTLFVGNMSFQMSDNDLNELFRMCKNVQDVRVAIDRKTGQPRGFAHCDFSDVESAQKAKEQLQGKEIYGRQLRVDFGLPSTLTRSKE